jgi:hypothetical protein
MRYSILIICILCIVVLYYSHTGPIDNFESSKTVEICITVFEEDLEWIRTIPRDLYSHIILYNKGSPKKINMPNVTVVNLSNYGRDVHTVLWHVVKNYDKLADVTFFLHGSVDTDPIKKHDYDLIKKKLAVKPDSSIVCSIADQNVIVNTLNTFAIDTWTNTNENNRRANPSSKLERSKYRPMGVWFNKVFPGEKLDCITFKGIFAVSREDILKRQKTFYESLLTQVSVKDSEVAHYIERAWISVFSIQKENYLYYNTTGFIEAFISSHTQ